MSEPDFDPDVVDTDTLAVRMADALADSGVRAEIGDTDEGVVDIQLHPDAWRHGPMADQGFDEVWLVWRAGAGGQWSLVAHQDPPYSADRNTAVWPLPGHAAASITCVDDIAADAAERIGADNTRSGR